MGKRKRIILGSILAGLTGLGSLLYYDSLPYRQSIIQLERPSARREIAGFSPLVITSPNSCPQYVIAKSISEVSERRDTGWKLFKVEVDFHNDSRCEVDKISQWEGNLMLGLFGTWKEGDYQNFIYGEAIPTVRWEGGGRDTLPINAKQRSLVIPNSNSTFIRVPKAAKDVRIDVDFNVKTTDTYWEGTIRRVPYFPGFSKDTKLPTDPYNTYQGRPVVDRLKAIEFVETWLKEHKSKIAINTGQAFQEIPKEAYEEWFRQKIQGFMIDNVERYKHPAITDIRINPTKGGLTINITLTNKSYKDDIYVSSSGFYVTDVLDSIGHAIKQYNTLRFSFKFNRDTIPPQYSDSGEAVIRRFHSFPSNARYLLGFLDVGNVSGSASDTLHYDPILVDLKDIYSEQPFKGRIAFIRPIKKLTLGAKDRILELVNDANSPRTVSR